MRFRQNEQIDMDSLQRELPGCKVTHDTPEGFIFSWNRILSGAREKSRDKKWIVFASDMTLGDMDTAPSIDDLVSSKQDAIDKACHLVRQLLQARQGREPS